MKRALIFLAITGAIFLTSGCYDKPKEARAPMVLRNCVEYRVKGESRTCSSYKFSQNPLHIVSKKAALLLETPKQSEFLWAFDTQRQELILEDRPVRQVPSCAFGLVLRTLVSPAKNAETLPVILFDNKDDRTPGDVFNLGKICGTLSFETPGSLTYLIAAQDKCPEEPLPETLSTCLGADTNLGKPHVLWDGQKAKALFEKNHQFYLDAYVGTR